MTRFSAFLQIFILTIISLLLTTGAALAAEQAGSVLAARGQVDAVNDAGAARALKIKADIFASDTVRTGKTGRAQLMFKDNSIVSLGVNSVMKIAEYHWNAEQKDGVMKTSVEEGTFRVLGGLITKHAPKNFITETPAATIGIRGSMYAGKVSKGETLVVFLGGKGIVVSNSQGQVVITEPGYGVVVKEGEPPGPPRLFTGEELAQLLEGDDAARGGQVLLSDRTSDFDKGTENRLPFDPDGFNLPFGGLVGELVVDFGQEGLSIEPLRTAPVRTGTVILEGVAVGLMPYPDNTGYYLLNKAFDEMDDVRLYIDRDDGTIDGNFDVADYFYSADIFPIVDNSNVTYINDWNFGGNLVCDGTPCVSLWTPSPGGYYDVFSSGNNFDTAPEAQQFSDYLAWGTWNLNIDLGGTQLPMDSSGALWIAGDRTPAAVVSDLTRNADGFVGTYSGPAYGVEVSGLDITNLSNGNASVSVDFFNDIVTGDLAFTEHTINFTGDIWSGESGNFIFRGMAPSTESPLWDTNVTGTFYGPGAESVGGSFISRDINSDVADPVMYQGIFGGNLTNGPAPVTVREEVIVIEAPALVRGISSGPLN